MSKNWFEVSKAGLSQAFGENGLTSLMFELVQNAWDAGAKTVEVDVKFEQRRAKFYVLDDGCGIEDLSAIYTVFGKSTSKSDSEKRGRFCIGDKLVLARCEQASVTSINGSVSFDADGRKERKIFREFGTLINGVMKCTKDEFEQLQKDMQVLIKPFETKLIFNSKEIELPKFISHFNATLPTIISDEEGTLKKSARQTHVQLFKAETQPMIYEMGIPVCEANCPYHVNIGQKVPLSMDRDKLPESFLKTLHALVLNATAGMLSDDQIKAAWVVQATSSKHIDQQAMQIFMDKRFGETRVSFDPSDKEANNRAVSKGFTVVTGGSLSGEQWENAKRFELVEAAGQVFPTPKPFDENGNPLKVIDPAQYTTEQKCMEYTAKWLGKNLLHKDIGVCLTDDPSWNFGGAYGPTGILYVSVVSFPKRSEQWLDLIIHEFGHEFCGNHLDAKFHEALTRLGARLARLVLNNPDKFKEWLF